MSTQDTGAEVKAGDIANSGAKADTSATAGDITKAGNGEESHSRTVPESAFLEEKKARKALEKEIKALRAKIEGGATDTDVSDSVDSIAERHNLNRDALREVTQSIRREVEAEVEAKVSKRLAPIEQGARAKAIREVFDTHFQKTMGGEGMEDFKGFVNKDIIFRLTLDPENANKTLKQIIEDTYGDAIASRVTADSSKPKGGSASSDFDPMKLNEDGYLDEVQSNPHLKSQYSKYLIELARR